jgi:hypothetical protein
MMQTQFRHGRMARRAIGLGVLLAVSSAVGGCVYYDESGQLAGPEQFCGYLYACGNHGGSDDNNEPSPDSTSSASSGGSSTSTGGQGATTPN